MRVFLPYSYCCHLNTYTVVPTLSVFNTRLQFCVVRYPGTHAGTRTIGVVAK